MSLADMAYYEQERRDAERGFTDSQLTLHWRDIKALWEAAAEVDLEAGAPGREEAFGIALRRLHDAGQRLAPLFAAANPLRGPK